MIQSIELGGKGGESMLFLEGEFFFEFLQLTSCSAALGLLLLCWGRESTWSAPQNFTGKISMEVAGWFNFILRPLSLQILVVLSESFLAFFNEIFFFPFPQLVFSFNDKLFGLLVKDMEAMDPSILKGESGTGKKQKVSSQELQPTPWGVQGCKS